MKFWSVLLAVMVVFASFNAEAARRMGGGGSFGKQSSNVTQQKNASPSAPNNVNKQAAPATPAAAPAKRPWGAMLGGLAAGLGLAWLASSLGLGGAMSQVLVVALLAMAAFALYRLFRRNRANNSASAVGATPRSPFAYSGGASGTAERGYNPGNVGNDASARPWEAHATQFQGAASAQATGSIIGSAIGGDTATHNGLSGSQTWGIPADFDTAGFLSAAKRNFVTLQGAWDRSDIDLLRSMMTDEMAAEIKSQLADRASHVGDGPNQTDVVSLDAQLLGIEDMGNEYLASVEFNGVIQESPSDGPSPFREVWNMSKSKTGNTGWLVAGVQALQ
jgi:predicted lipid-binding transport protein (Tim44 family)